MSSMNLPMVAQLLGSIMHSSAAPSSAQTQQIPNPADLNSSALGSQDVVDQGKQEADFHAAKASEAVDTAQGAGNDAAVVQLQHDTAVENAQGPVLEQENQNIQSMDSHFADAMADVGKRKEEGLNKYLTAVEDLKGTHVYSWWANAGTGATILGVLSQALAGGLQGMNGQSGPTPLDRIIEQDLAKQKLNLAQKSDVAQQSGGLFRDLVAQLKDTVLAEGAIRDIAYNSTIHRLKDLAGQQPQAQATYLKMVADLQERMAQNRVQIEQYMAKTSMDYGMAKGGFMEKYTGLWTAQRGQDLDYAAKLAAQGSPVAITGVPNSEALVKSIGHDAFDRLKQRWDATNHIEANTAAIDDLLSGKITDKDGHTLDKTNINKTSVLAAKLNSRLGDIQTDLDAIKRLGAISAGDKAIIDAIVGAKGGWSTIFEANIPGLRDYSEIAETVRDLALRTRERMDREIHSFSVNGQPLKAQ